MKRFLVVLAMVLGACQLVALPPNAVQFEPRAVSNVEWQLEIRDPFGTLRYTRGITSIVDTLDSFVIGADGDCKEATFKALSSSLGIGSRDIVTLQTRPVFGSGVWTNRYAGITVRPGANFSVTYSQFKLAGLRERLKRVEVRDSSFAIGTDIAVIARTAVQTLIASGQLGNAVIYDVIQIPLSGLVTTREIRPANMNFVAFFDQLAALWTGSTWGVDSSRKVFFRVPAALSIAFDEATAGTEVVWEDVNAETVVSAVRWIGPNGLTHISSDTTLTTSYGHEVLEVPLDPAFIRWLDAGATYGYTSQPVTTVGSTSSIYGGATSVTSGLNAAYLVDGEIAGTTYVSIGGGGVGDVAQVLTATASNAYDRVLFKAQAYKNLSLNPTTASLIISRGGTRLYPQSNQAELPLPSWLVNIALEYVGNSGDVITVNYSGNQYVQLNVATLMFQVLDRAYLDELARAYYRAPSLDPASIKRNSIIDLARDAVITRRDAIGVSLGSVTRKIQTFEYKFNRDDYATTIIRVGQAATAEALAQADVIRSRDDASRASAARFATVTPP
jgi:hypothetical protein